MGCPAGVVWGPLPCFVEGLCAGRGGRPAGASERARGRSLVGSPFSVGRGSERLWRVLVSNLTCICRKLRVQRGEGKAVRVATSGQTAGVRSWGLYSSVTVRASVGIEKLWVVPRNWKRCMCTSVSSVLSRESELFQKIQPAQGERCCTECVCKRLPFYQKSRRAYWLKISLVFYLVLATAIRGSWNWAKG